MNKVTALLLCFCIAIPTAFATCPLAAVMDPLKLVNAIVGSATAQTGVNYCTSVASASCCPTATLNALKTNSDTLQGELESAFGLKDKAILEARKNLRSLEGNYTVLKLALNESKSNVNSWTSDGTYGAAATKVKNFIADFEDFFDKVFTGYNGIQTSFDTYQTNRQTCMNKLLETTVNARCFACVEANANEVTASGVAVDSSINNAITTACWNYINASDYQSNILQLNPYNSSLTALTSAAIQIANGTKDAVNTFVTTLTTVKNANKAYPAVVMPTTNCASSTACDWIATNLFSGALTGDTNSRAAILGGGVAYTYISRVLPESRPRSLATMTTTNMPNAGVTVSFAKNPAGVTNSVDPSGLSAFRIGVISSLVALFVAFLF